MKSWRTDTESAPPSIASQFPIDTWHDIIGDSTLADAICDGVIHNAYKIILKPGEESMRKIHSTLT